MDFWQFIEAHCERPLSVKAASSYLEEALRKRSAAEIGLFCREFDRLMAEAYTWDLWGVAYLINGGCGDDSFLDFRSSLIGLGERVYSRAISDAESLIDLPSEELQEMFAEGLLYCATNAYEHIAGETFGRSASPTSEPAGEPWDETRESLMNRFPRVWAVYGWENDTEPEPQQKIPAKKPWWKFW